MWESVGRDSELISLTDSQREELDRRLDELESEGPTGMSWDEVVARVRACAGQSMGIAVDRFQLNDRAGPL